LTGEEIEGVEAAGIRTKIPRSSAFLNGRRPHPVDRAELRRCLRNRSMADGDSGVRRSLEVNPPHDHEPIPRCVILGEASLHVVDLAPRPLAGIRHPNMMRWVVSAVSNAVLFWESSRLSEIQKELRDADEERTE
jgi:hypothetical protein